MTEALAPYRGPRLCVIAVTLLVAILLVAAVAMLPAWRSDYSSQVAEPPIDPTPGFDNSAETSTTPTAPPDTTSTTPAPPSTTVDLAGLTVVTASDFSIGYPQGWTVEKQDVVPAGTTYKDTTIKRDVSDPHYVVRVDVAATGNPSQTVDAVVAGLSQNPGFRQLARQQTSFVTTAGTYDAVVLEFLLNHQDTGVAMHTVDVFFNDNRGRSFAVLTRAPESDYSNVASLYERVRASIVPR